MATSNPTTLSEIIWWGFCFLLACGVGETLRRLWRIEKKQDGFQEKCPQCKDELKKEFVSKEYMDKWEKGRTPLKHAIEHHTHEGIEGEGRVIIS